MKSVFYWVNYSYYNVSKDRPICEKEMYPWKPVKHLYVCLFIEKGVVYVDSDTSEDEDLDTLNSTCRGHGISVFSDPHNVTFQIVKTKIHDESKRVVSSVSILLAER